MSDFFFAFKLFEERSVCILVYQHIFLPLLIFLKSNLLKNEIVTVLE